MRLLLLLCVVCGASSLGYAQESLFQSGDGKTSLYLRDSTAAINLGDSKASLGYTSETNDNPWSWGAGVYATSNSGIISLFSSDDAKAPEGGGGGVVAYHWTNVLPGCPKGFEHCTINVKEHTLLLDAGYGRSSFFLYPTAVDPSTSLSKTDFNRFRTIVAWNFFFAGNKIVGFATGVERRNNLDDLKSVNLDTVVIPAPTGTPNSIVKMQAGYYGDYKKYIGAPIYFDLLRFLPSKVKIPGFDDRLAFDLLSRADIAAPNRGANGGIGLFLMDSKDPLKTLGGVTATYDGTKFQFSLTAGFTSSK
jgi:hypothetical protein